MGICLVTGGAGFIGSHIAERLLSDGEKVRILDNLSTGRLKNISSFKGSLEFIEGDIRDEEKLSKAASGVDCIFHQAALPSVSRSVEDPARTNDCNIRGVLQTLLAARNAHVKKFVFASSSSVYGDKELLPKTEAQMPEPLSPYAVSKLTGEHYCRTFWINYRLQTVSLRYFNVFGPRQDPNSDYAAVVPSFISRILKNTPPDIYGDGNQTRDFTYVGNVVEANIRACREPLKDYGVFMNVCTGERVSVNGLFQEISSLLDKKLDPVYGPPRAGDVRDSQGDPARMKTLLKMSKLISFRDGLKEAIGWYKENLS